MRTMDCCTYCHRVAWCARRWDGSEVVILCDDCRQDVDYCERRGKEALEP